MAKKSDMFVKFLHNILFGEKYKHKATITAPLMNKSW